MIGIQMNLRAMKKNKINVGTIIQSIFKTFLLSLMIVAQVHFAFAQTTQGSLIPNGQNVFLDNNGKPLSSGKVYFYQQGTTTPKTTYKDINQTIPNLNPVVLDASGRPSSGSGLWGIGIYRQVVKDKNDNLIWDVNTSTGNGPTGTTATGDGQVVGSIKMWPGATPPNQYAFTYGQTLNRVTYAPLFQAITSQQSVNCTSGNPTISGLSNTDSFWIGMTVELACVPGGVTTISSKTAFTITLAANANANETITATFFMWGNGNGSTTFNLPDYRGLIPMGNNIMGGIASGNMSDSNFGSQSASSAGGQGGAQTNSTTLLTNNLPPYTPAGTPVLNSLTLSSNISSASGGGTTNITTGGFSTNVNMAFGIAASSLSFTGTPQGGTSTPFTTIRIPPSKTVNFVIKVTPDTAFSGTGVTSLGGMTGDIACGNGLTCAGSTISVSGSFGLIVGTTSISSGTNPRVLFDNAGVLGELITVPIAQGGSGQSTTQAARSLSGFNIDAATASGDANYVIQPSDRMVYHTALSAARTDTLPAANSVNAGQQFVINDFAGVASGVKTITLQRAGADTINGVTSVVAVNAQYGAGIFWSDGTSRWTFQPTSAGGGGGTVTSVATGNGLFGGTISTSGTISASPQTVSGGRLSLESGSPVPTSDQKPFKVVVLTNPTTSWAVPADWNNANNTIEVIGAGGGGNNSVGGGGGTGGGGGAYSLASNVTLSGTVTIQVGAGGAATVAGTDTYLCNTLVTNCATIAGTAVQVGAKGGGGGVTSGTAAVAGGASGSGVGSTKFSGGSSGTATAANLCSSGAGGAAGPHGNGGNGGASGTTGSCTGTGGSADGGNVVASAVATAGSTGNIWIKNDNTTVQVGGGGGGAAGVGGTIGGLYGGGSSGGTNGIGGQTGRNGVIVITYLPANAASTLYYAPCFGIVTGCGGPYVGGYDGTNMVLRSILSSPTDTVGLTHILHGATQIAGNCYDEYIGNNSGTITLGNGVAWTTCAATNSAGGTRGSGAGTAQVASYNGLPVNANAMTISYDNGGGSATFSCPQYQCTRVGSFIATNAGGINLQLNPPALYGGNNTVLGLDNVFNRIEREVKSQDQTGTWSYNSSVARDANGSSSNRITFIDGSASDSWQAEYINSFAPNSASAAALTIGMCLNLDCTSNGGFTNAGGAGQILGQGASNNQAIGSQIFAKLSPYPFLGLNFIQAAEQSTSVATTQFGEDFMRLTIRKKF